MDSETLNTITEAVQKAADTAVAKMREFHLDDLKALGERMDIGFESVHRRIDGVDVRLDGIDSRLDGIDVRLDKIEVRLDRVENALATLLQEFKEYSNKVHSLEKQVSELTMRVKLLEEQLTTSR